MADTRRFGWVDVLLLLLVLATAGGCRASYLWHFADNGGNGGPFLVQDAPRRLNDLEEPATHRPPEMRGHRPPSELDALVHNLKEYQWFGCLTPFASAEEPTAHVAPGYPWALGLLA